MIAHYQFEQRVYHFLNDLKVSHPDLHFAMRHKAGKGYERQRFIGAEGKYFGTTFWKITTDSFTGPAYPVGLYFHPGKNGYGYHLQARQARHGTSERDRALLDVVNSLLDSEGKFFDRATGKDKNNNNQIVTINAPEEGYDDLDKMFQDVEKDLEVFVPFIDEKLQTAKVQTSSFEYRRLTQKDTDEFERKYIQRVARLDDKNFLGQDGPINSENIFPLERGHPLNQILYAPPGTGKTYSTINRAITIVNPAFAKSGEKSREDVRNEYQRLLSEGKIVFTTFHQSLSYEDFVEGLKPVIGEDDKNDDGQVRYTVKRGIFRNACDMALKSIVKKRPSESTRKVLDFDRKYELLAEQVAAQLLETGEYKLDSRNGGSVLVDDISTHGNFRAQGGY